MVKKNIGVIGLQGAVTEHVKIIQKTLKETNTSGTIKIVRKKEDLKDINGLIIPGGESTTISRMLSLTGLYQSILKKAKQKKITIMGTCAGCVILGSKLVDKKNLKHKIQLLNLIDMKVKRNAYGPQKESFEKDIDIKDLKKPYRAVFIRAPIIEETYGDAQILATVNKKPVMVKKDNYLAITFHPELTEDIRIHKKFLEML